MGFIKKYKIAFALGLLLLVGLFLRIWDLGTIPGGFHQDEVANAYLGRFILLNGKDIYGNVFPLFYVNKWGDFPPAIPMYISAFGTFLFGVNPFGARIVIAVIGALTLIPVYIISNAIFKNKMTALFSSFLLTVLPWHVAFSRVSAEGIVGLFVFTTALAFYLCSYVTKKYVCFFGALLLFMCTMFLYPSYRVVVPLTFVTLFLFAKPKESPLKKILIAFIIISFLTTAVISQTEWGRSRFSQTSLFNTVASRKDELTGYITHEKNPIVARVFNNKLFLTANEFTKQFVSYLSPLYLFVNGGYPEWYQFPNSGLLYVSLILLCIPFILPFLFKKETYDKKLWITVLILLAIAILPSALTTEHSPNTHRSILMILPLVLFFSFGFDQFIREKKTRLLSLGIVALIGFETLFFVHNYFTHVSYTTAIHRSDGNMQAAQYLKDHRNEYKTVYMYATGWFPVYYLFVTNNFSPSIIGQMKNGLRNEKIDNIRFIDSDSPDMKYLKEKDAQGNIAYIFNYIGKNSLPKKYWDNKIDTIHTSTGIQVYEVYKINNK